MFIGLLTSQVNGSNYTKCISFSNQKCMTQPTPFAVKLDRNDGSCNTLNDLSNKVCVPNKSGISINVDVSAENIIYMKKIIFGSFNM